MRGGRHARSGARARLPRRPGHAGAGQVVRSCDLGHRASRRARLPYRLQSASCTRLEGPMTSVVLSPGGIPLGTWREIYGGASVTLDPAAYAVIETSARAVSAILAKGEPIYGINTGFGKLASVRIGAADLQTLQRNIVLSHAAGVGQPMLAPIARLMIALKLASLAQGASGVQATTVRLLEGLLAKGLTPVIPCQGSVGASGDLAPLAHMAAAMIGVGEIFAGER